MNSYKIHGTGESLLLIHGALVSQAMWALQIAEFSKDFKVITCDLPAHGIEEDLAGIYTIEKLAEMIIALLDIINIEKTHICGHSLGGMIAQEIAVKYPDRVNKLILAETAFGTKNNVWERLQTSVSQVILKITPYKMIINMSVKQYGSLNKQVGEFVKKEMMRYSQNICRRVMNAALEYTGKEQLKKIKSPTLVLVGKENEQTHSQGREMATRIPNAKLIIIEHANHLLNMDNPNEFNQKVLEFLRYN